jgi:hypothetical protein
MIVIAMAERCRRAGAGAERGRDETGDDRQRGHQNRPEPDAVGFQDRLRRRNPRSTEPVHRVDLQNAVFLHNPQQQQDAEGLKTGSETAQ